MHRELVDEKRWISEGRFLHALNYCMLLPGPEAQQLATYIGWLMHRTLGGVAAGLLFVLPSLFILIGLSWVYVAFGNVPWVAGLLYGIKPAVAAIVLQAVHRVGSKTLKKPTQATVLWAIAGMSFIAIAFLNVPFPWVVAAAALTGWLCQRVGLKQFAGGGGHGAAKTTAVQASALIDDTTPTPEHARYKPIRLARVALMGAALWLLPMGALVAWQGWEGAGGADGSCLVAVAHGRSDAVAGLGGCCYANGLVLYQGGLADIWWGLCRAALRLSGWC